MKEVLFKIRLRELRKEKNITAKELADFLGFSRNAVTEWENGRATPDYLTLWEIADYFDVTIDYLIGRSEI